MVNTANAEGRVYRAERSHGKKNRRKFSSIMAMVLGAIVTIEIMIMGAMDFETGFSFCRQDCPGTWLYGIIFRCSHSIGR